MREDFTGREDTNEEDEREQVDQVKYEYEMNE